MADHPTADWVKIALFGLLVGLGVSIWMNIELFQRVRRVDEHGIALTRYLTEETSPTPTVPVTFRDILIHTGSEVHQIWDKIRVKAPDWLEADTEHHGPPPPPPPWP